MGLQYDQVRYTWAFVTAAGRGRGRSPRRCRCYHKPRVLSAIEDVPPRRSTAPSQFTFIYSSETCPWIVSLSASLLATDNTQPKANEEMRWHKKKERSPLFPWLTRTGWLQLHFFLGISRRFHIEQPLEARKIGEKAPLYLSPLLFISENLVNLEFDSCGAFLSPRQLSSALRLIFSNRCLIWL